jgi:hypothetical protein
MNAIATKAIHTSESARPVRSGTWIRPASGRTSLLRSVGALAGRVPDYPGPGRSFDDAPAAVGIRASGRQHPVQDRHADRSLGLQAGTGI